MRRAAIYARVSTVDRGQDPETQLRQLREYADRRGFALTEEYVDHASGSRNDRERYRAMLEAARKRRFDVLLVWRYDRFARSMQELVNALADFEGLGIDFISYNEGADTTTPQGRLLFGIMASLAEFERSLIAERVRAGMERAKAQGKHTGRPRLPGVRLRLLRQAAPRSKRDPSRGEYRHYRCTGTDGCRFVRVRRRPPCAGAGVREDRRCDWSDDGSLDRCLERTDGPGRNLPGASAPALVGRAQAPAGGRDLGWPTASRAIPARCGRWSGKASCGASPATGAGAGTTTGSSRTTAA